MTDNRKSVSREEILIVEDSPTQALDLKHILDDHGFVAVIASNGEEALEYLRKYKPKVVLSDIVMPGMSGYQLCNRVREMDAARDIPVILLTSLSDPEDVIRGLECGADSFITKPYDEDYLVSRIQYTLTNSHLKGLDSARMGVEIMFAGRKHFITSDRLQILNLLLSTYETAIMKNRQLTLARDELRTLNEELDEKVQARTAQIRAMNEGLEQRVAERTEELMEANRELDAFSYSVSHDLRAPLRHILGFVEMLKKHLVSGLDETGAQYMKNISDSAQRMGTLIEDLLSFSHTARADMRIIKVGMEGLVKDQISQLAPETSGRSIAWKLGVLPDIKGDPSMISQVLANLLSNAVKFTRKREHAEIEVAAKPGEGQGTTFMVRDNGAGFDQAYSDKLFGVFQRLHGQGEFEGTGIGLANVRRIILRHGGKVWAEGMPGKGATFYFWLPGGKHGVRWGNAETISAAPSGRRSARRGPHP